MSTETVSADNTRNWRNEKRPISVNELGAPKPEAIENLDQVLKTPYCSRSKRIEPTWAELVQMLLTPVKAAKPSDKLAQLTEKVSHGWWSPSVFKPSRRIGKNCVQVSWAALDIDEECPPLAMLARRMRGAGLEGVIVPSYSAAADTPKTRIVIAIDKPVVGADLAELKKRLEAVQRSLAALLGVRIDTKVSKDPARLFWGSVDNGENLFGQAEYVEGALASTDLLVALGQKRISWQSTLEAWGQIGGSAKVNSNDNHDIRCPFDAGHSQPPKDGDAFLTPEGHFVCNHTTCSKGQHGEHASSGRSTQGYIVQMVLTGERQLDSVVEELTDGEKFERGELIGVNALAKRLVARHGSQVRYNTFTRRREVSLNGEAWTKSWDAFVAQVQQLWPRDPKRRGSEGIGFSTLDKALRVVAEYDTYDPRLEWLEGLAWDGVSRLSCLFHKGFGAEDTLLNRVLSRKLVHALVERAVTPGAKYDFMVVLTGEQEVGKSLGLASLMPEQSYFTDKVHLGMRDQKLTEQLGGKWIAEFQEMSGHKRREVEELKALVTSSDDSTRLAYREDVQDFPRTSVFVGTSNDFELMDPTGDRRFPIVECAVGAGQGGGDKCDPAWIAENRDQMFAEAWARRGEEPLFFSDTEDDKAAREELRALQSSYKKRSPLYDIVVSVMADAPSGVSCCVRVADVKERVRYELRARDEGAGLARSLLLDKYVNEDMAALGFVQAKPRLGRDPSNPRAQTRVYLRYADKGVKTPAKELILLVPVEESVNGVTGPTRLRPELEVVAEEAHQRQRQRELKEQVSEGRKQHPDHR